MIYKKIILIVLLLLIIILAVIVWPYFCVYSGTQVSRETYDMIKNTREENLYYPAIGELLVNGVAAFESQGEGWWLCSLPKGTDYSSISVSAKLCRIPIKLAVLKEDFSQKSLEQNQEIKIIVYSAHLYREYLLHITTLPIFTLNTNSEAPWEDEAAYFNGHSATVHVRGRSTKSYPKVGFRITLSEKTSFLGMREDDDWVLYAGYNDQERIRNVFSSNLWYDTCAGNNEFGVKNGYEYRYIELFHNGKYSGLYALGYKPDQKQFEIEEGEFLYQRVSLATDDFELHGSKTKSDEIGAWNALKSEYSEDVWSTEDYWLFVQFCAAVDNTDMNYYLALKSNENGYVAVYCPWDLDLTWGNKYNGGLPNTVETYAFKADDSLPVKGHAIDFGIQKLIESNDRETIQLLKSRYAELRENQWSDENLCDRIDEYEELIFNSGAYRRDISRWPDSTQMDCADVHLEQFKEYLLNRASYVDGIVNNMG